MTLIHADKETKTITSFHVIICIYQYSYQGVDARDSTRRGDVSLQEKVGGFPSSPSATIPSLLFWLLNWGLIARPQPAQ